MADPPLPESEEFAATEDVNVYVFTSVIDAIWCSALSISAVIAPPRETALLKVTKSPNKAP